MRINQIYRLQQYAVQEILPTLIGILSWGLNIAVNITKNPTIVDKNVLCKIYIKRLSWTTQFY